MHLRLPFLAPLAVSIAATDAFAQTTAASPPTDYGNPQAWLCRPGYFDAEGRTAMPMAPSDAWTVGGQPIATPHGACRGAAEVACTSNEFASYPDVSIPRGPDRPASRDIQGGLREPFGLHSVDMEVAMGNLIDLVGQQTKSYLTSTRRR